MNIVPFDLKGAPRIGPEEARKVYHKLANVVFVDVRPEADFERSRIPGAISMPLREIPRRIGELSPDAEIITY